MGVAGSTGLDCRAVRALWRWGAAHKLRRMAHAQLAPIDLFDYLAFDEANELRHEFVGGRIHAMSGGTLRHNRIAGNIYSALLSQPAGSLCQVFINDVKLHVQAADCVYYPDVLVHCGGGLAGTQKMLTDATLVVEVLSESTAEIDRREKLAAYQKLPSLRSYWVVSQDQARVETHTRGEDGRWTMSLVTQPADTLATPGVPGAPLQLGALYVGTDIG